DYYCMTWHNNAWVF
nr:immunoglobulin light chain junction region [Macaca mulatta]MOY05221.1 immunoglobulin light chain junction region [Macaca mulatta]MOY05376.1 immunoglobulin light chain junction region [Macaca mulatta]MOY05388.1 immunoglobulin light chain junction region [Macaca mulatta]MOY05515.1 immunoglobulin light chain junction region [Macaca mulatta]